MMTKLLTPPLLGAMIAASFVHAEESVPDGKLSDVHFGEVVNGVEFDETELEGKVVVVEKWGTRCPPCIAFLPELAKIHKRYQKKGLEVVGMEVQRSETKAITDLLDDARVKYPVVAGGRTPASSGGIPYANVFGADGKLVWAGNPHAEGFLDSIKDALRDMKDMPAAEEPEEEESTPLVDSREWTNSDGKTIRATALRIEGGKVIFQMKGREVPYDLEKLSESDQELLREAEGS